jgi:aldose 1-epimerase
MTAPAVPSGDQIELSFDDQRAVVTEVGAGLRTYSADGREMLDGYPAEELAGSGRGQLLIPWPNRIRDGAYELDGRRHQLPLNEPERGNAIHGLVRWSSWSVAERATERVVLAHMLRPQPGYPFTLELRAEYSLSAEGLAVRTTATNTAADACPTKPCSVSLLRPFWRPTSAASPSAQRPSWAPSWTSASLGRSGVHGSTTASRTSTAPRTDGYASKSTALRCGPTRAIRT